MARENVGGRPEADFALRRRISERLNQLRGNETQKEFSNRIELSSEKQIGRYLRAESSPSVENLVQIAEKTETSLDWLVLGRERRTLEPDDDVADQLWLRVMKQAQDEGAESAAAERVIPPPAALLEEVLDLYAGRGRCVAPLIIPPGTNKFDVAAIDSGRDLMASHVKLCDKYLEGIRMHKEQYRVVARTTEKVLAGQSLDPQTPAE